MHKMNIYGDNWLMFKEWYQNLTTKVKWEGQISRGFEEKQGVRQGGVWDKCSFSKIFPIALVTVMRR
jgi:hypothetical protein